MPAMIIPNIEEEASVENFNPTFNKEQLKLSFSVVADGDMDMMINDFELDEFDPNKIPPKRARLESIDKPVSGFLFLEEDYVETAMFGELDSPKAANAPQDEPPRGSALSNFLDDEEQLDMIKELSTGEVTVVKALEQQLDEIDNRLTPPKIVKMSKSMPSVQAMLQKQGININELEEVGLMKFPSTADNNFGD